MYNITIISASSLDKKEHKFAQNKDP